MSRNMFVANEMATKHRHHARCLSVCVCFFVCVFWAIPYATNIPSKQRHDARWFGVCVCVLVCLCVFWGHPICHEYSSQTTISCAAEDYVQHTATLCNIPQHTATHCNTLQQTQHTATYCNTLQHTATHCKILQDTAIHSRTTDDSFCGTLALSAQLMIRNMV